MKSWAELFCIHLFLKPFSFHNIYRGEKKKKKKRGMKNLYTNVVFVLVDYETI